MHERDEICRSLLSDCGARCVFLVDYCDRELVALGDMNLEDAQRLVASMPSESADDSGMTLHVDAPRFATRQSFSAGGYLLVLIEDLDTLATVVVRVSKTSDALARFAGPPERARADDDSSSGAAAHVAALRR